MQLHPTTVVNAKSVRIRNTSVFAASGETGRPTAKAFIAAPIPQLCVPVTSRTSPVSVQRIKVSNTIAVIEMSPCSSGLTPSAAADAIGAVPIPASLEKSPRLTPAMTVPSSPPPTARGWKAV